MKIYLLEFNSVQYWSCSFRLRANLHKRAPLHKGHFFGGGGRGGGSPYIDSPQSGRSEEVEQKYITIEIGNTKRNHRKNNSQVRDTEKRTWWCLTRKWGLDSLREIKVATSEYIESLNASKRENSLPASEALSEWRREKHDWASFNLAWEDSRHFTTQKLVSQRNEACFLTLNSILVTRHFSDLGSESDWFIGLASLIWNFCACSSASFRGETNSSVAKGQQFSQDKKLNRNRKKDAKKHITKDNNLPIRLLQRATEKEIN